MDIISKKEAKKQGLQFYFTGKSCKRGHISERYLSSSCIACVREYSITNSEQIKEYSKNHYSNNKERYVENNNVYKANNLEQIKEYQQEYYSINKENIKVQRVEYNTKNPEQVKENSLKYRTKNPKQVSMCNKNWRFKHPEKVAASSRLRNTRLEQAIPTWYERDLVNQLYVKRNELNVAWGTNFQVDHIIPINPRDRSVCGLHCWANLQLLDQSINDSKRDNYNQDW